MIYVSPGRHGEQLARIRAKTARSGSHPWRFRFASPASGGASPAQTPLQADPIDGGSANNYDYAGQDPINGYNLTHHSEEQRAQTTRQARMVAEAENGRRVASSG
jgi:hypothetical protein